MMQPSDVHPAMITAFWRAPNVTPNHLIAAALTAMPDDLLRQIVAERGCVMVPIPKGLHPRTADLVRRFAPALAEKLHSAEQKYGYSDAWAKSDWMDKCREDLVMHVYKGDPRDVAAYCAFLWHHGEHTAMRVGKLLDLLAASVASQTNRSE